MSPAGVHTLSKIGTRAMISSSTCHQTWHVPRSELSSSQWTFFTGSDPTNGNVNYLSMEDAKNQGLAYVNGNNAVVLAVDSRSSVPPGGNRNSYVAFMRTSVDGLISDLQRSHHVQQELQQRLVYH